MQVLISDRGRHTNLIYTVKVVNTSCVPPPPLGEREPLKLPSPQASLDIDAALREIVNKL